MWSQQRGSIKGGVEDLRLFARTSPMLIGYVSDERYAALPDVLVEFIDDSGKSWEAHSRASGAIHGDCPEGDYTAILAKPGYGSKRVRVEIRSGAAHQFR